MTEERFQSAGFHSAELVGRLQEEGRGPTLCSLSCFQNKRTRGRSDELKVKMLRKRKKVEHSPQCAFPRIVPLITAPSQINSQRSHTNLALAFPASKKKILSIHLLLLSLRQALHGDQCRQCHATITTILARLRNRYACSRLTAGT